MRLKFFVNKLKKKCDQTRKKTSRESRKAALRVGLLSRCWGDKKKLWQTSKTQILEKKTLKTQIVTELKNSNCDQTQKLKLWQNSKTETETKHKNFKWDKTQKLKKKVVTKLKTQKCDKTQTQKLRQNLKTQIVTKLKNTNCDKTKKNIILTKLNKIKMWQN